jgi:hypothetical protein
MLHQFTGPVIDHTTRRVCILGTTLHTTTAWATRAARNRAMDLQDAGHRARFLIRDHDSPLFDTITPTPARTDKYLFTWFEG